MNPVGSCQRNICECDKAFASKLQGAAEDPADGWTEVHHAHYGGFDSRNQCLRKLGNPSDDKELVCCGDYPDRLVYHVITEKLRSSHDLYSENVKFLKVKY